MDTIAPEAARWFHSETLRPPGLAYSCFVRMIKQRGSIEILARAEEPMALNEVPCHLSE